MLETFRSDLRYGIRSLSKRPGFLILAVSILSLGVGATTAIFSLVNSVLLRPLPFKDPDQLVWVWSRRTDNNKAPFSMPDYLDYRDQNTTLQQTAAFGNVGLNLLNAERTERLQGVRLSANYFEMLGINAALGRVFTSADDQPDRKRVVNLTYECWQRRYSGDTQIIGRTLILNGEDYIAIGVLPKGFSLPNATAELSVPLAADSDPSRTVRGSVNFLRIVGRLKSGVTRAQAEADLSAINARQQQQFGESYAKKIGVNVIPLQDELIGDVRVPLLVVLGTVVFVLLIGCLNLAALSLTRASGREQEILIRKALGASPFRLVRQLFLESLTLGLLGCIGGLAIATLGLQTLLLFGSAQLPKHIQITTDWRVLGFAVAIGLLSVGIVGILPALYASRVEVKTGLGGSNRGVGGQARLNRWRRLLVIGEVAISYMLLMGAALLIQSLARVMAVNPGFDPFRTVAIRVSLPESTYHDRAAVSLFADKLVSRIETTPGVEAIGAISILPMSGGGNIIQFSSKGRETSVNDKGSANFRPITPGYLRVMKIPLLSGRFFDEHDKADSIPVALINRTMALRVWPGEDPIGKQILIDDNNTGPRPVQVAGVVGDVRQINLESDYTNDIYIPLSQIHEDGVRMLTNSTYWVVRSTTDLPSVRNTFIEELRRIDQAAATSDIKTVEEYISDSIASRKVSLSIITIFAAAAFLLATVGIYGVISYVVIQRTPEIGIRLAIGAKQIQVFRLILNEGAKVVSIGLLSGIFCALVMARTIRSMLFGITPADPQTFIYVCGLIFFVGMVACVVPAAKATQVDPMIALRND